MHLKYARNSRACSSSEDVPEKGSYIEDAVLLSGTTLAPLIGDVGGKDKFEHDSVVKTFTCLGVLSRGGIL
jgi:hypothetical protein